MVGVTIGAASSCSLFDNQEDLKPKTCDETCDLNCDVNHTPQDEVFYDCPACGMG
ncbi:MAG: hypothetical protein DHS20C18_06270 [Saprospiraceae bacterium]|nr:MAG: hypothetical protein DHS20C18_06270 [Saprospiraceae bacterium]